METLEQFKQKFFDLPSRVFGETYVEPILRKVLNHSSHEGSEYDAVQDGKRIEYKAVRVVFTAKKEKKSLMYDRVLSNSHMSERIGTLGDIENGKIVANCQNIKLDEFDVLVYVLVDNDGFHIFRAEPKMFIDGDFPNWCPNHGSKEKGKNGQFPINAENVSWHKDNCYKQSLSWDKVLELSQSIEF